MIVILRTGNELALFAQLLIPARIATHERVARQQCKQRYHRLSVGYGALPLQVSLRSGDHSAKRLDRFPIAGCGDDLELAF